MDDSTTTDDKPTSPETNDVLSTEPVTTASNNISTNEPATASNVTSTTEADISGICGYISYKCKNVIKDFNYIKDPNK